MGTQTAANGHTREQLEAAISVLQDGLRIVRSGQAPTEWICVRTQYVLAMRKRLIDEFGVSTRDADNQVDYLLLADCLRMKADEVDK